ncbi:MAG: flagellar basal body P-ring protein FlgI [Planctomycetaceae bacterium]|nr:flagellar basal body P-ring protein FlgI [Planctomycetaceae bacterium]
MSRLLLITILTLAAGLTFDPARFVNASEVRIKDITDVGGVRANQLTGMGLVVGLNGTGGKTAATRRFAVNLLQRFGQRTDPTVRALLETNTQMKTNSMSVVVVTAELPAFARIGSRIDVVVSTFDDASSLQGGVLILTPLLGVDGQAYAVASGPVSTGGFSFEGQAGSIQKNHPTTGRIPNGAIVEEETCTSLGTDGVLTLQLRDPDFETARRLCDAVNESLPGAARSIDSSVVSIQIPPQFQADVPGLLGTLGSLTIEPDAVARVVINERTGTVIIGDQVRLSRVLITHANLAVMTSEAPQVSQPPPFSDGETTVVPRTELNVREEQSRVNVVDDVVTVGELAQALNALGVSARDLSSIFQQLKESGALHAELEFK